MRYPNLTVGTLNIAMAPPHSPDRYRDLFKYLNDIQESLSGGYYGDTRLVLLNATVHPENGNVYGKFVKYTQVDPRKPWFSKRKRAAILDKDGKPEQVVSPEFGPNYEKIPFLFHPVGHLLHFDTLKKTISPRALSRALFEIFSSLDVFALFGNINVTVVPEHDVMERILSLPHIRRIDVVWTQPNPDVPTDDAQEILDRFGGMNVGKSMQTFFASPHESSIPDRKLLAFMDMAKTNGYNTVKGRDENNRSVTLSTKDYPLLKSCPVRPQDGYWEVTSVKVV